MTTGYFNRINNINYDLTGNSNYNNMTVKNIFFRFHILNSVLNDSLVYYEYYLNDGDTPETVAYRYYKDITKHWVVMMANKIVDPQYDWPLSYQSFITYINKKYGSIADAKTLIHGYTKNIQKQDSNTGDITTNIVNIDFDTYNNTPQYNYQPVNLQDGSTVTITTTTSIIYAYDYEYDNNESKKNIILIDKQYLTQIDNEFSALAMIG